MGLIDYAKSGAEKYTNDKEKEKQFLEDSYYSIDDAIKNEDTKYTGGLVAFFYEHFSNSTTNERNISVIDYNDNYVELNDKTILIKKPGEYIVFANVGRISKFGYSTVVNMYINGQLVQLTSTCSNNSNLGGMGQYSFTVDEKKPVEIRTTLVSDSTYGDANCGSLVLVKRKNIEQKFKEGLVAVFNKVYTTSSTEEISIPITEYNNEYAESDGLKLTIKEPGEYSVFASVGRSSQHGWTTYGSLYINDETINRDGYSGYVTWACPDYGSALGGTYKYTFSVKEEPMVIAYKAHTDGAWSGKNCASLIVVKNS